MALPRQRDLGSIRRAPRSVRGTEIASQSVDAQLLQGTEVSEDAPIEGEVLVLRGSTFVPESIAAAQQKALKLHSSDLHAIDYEVSPSPFDAIVDGLGHLTGHYAQPQDAIDDGVSGTIYIRHHPDGIRYGDISVASGDAVAAIIGAGPGLLVGAINIQRAVSYIASLESNARVKIGGVQCYLERIDCKGATDTGFDIEGVGDPGLGGDCKMINCRVLESTGIALNYGRALHGLLVINFYVRNLTGEHVIKTNDPDGMIIGLDIAATNVAPTKEPILLDGGIGAVPTFSIFNGLMACTVPNTYNLIKAENLMFLSLVNLANVNEAADGTPVIYLNNNQAGAAGSYYVENVQGFLVFSGTLFDVPAAAIGLTLIAGCRSENDLVTGTGRWNGRANSTGSGFVADRHDFNDLNPATDNARKIGTSALSWSQVWGHILGVRNYADLMRVSAPANPATDRGRVYVRAIDGSSDGLYVKIKQDGSIVEQQLSRGLVVTKTGDYTPTVDDDVILCDASGGAFLVTLLPASGLARKTYHIKKTDSSGNAVTIDGDASETIDGDTTKVINVQYDSMMIICDGSNWHII